jgi:hypothetical protein
MKAFLWKETCLQQQEQGIIITPGIDDLSSNSNKKHKVDEIHNYAIAHDMLLQVRGLSIFSILF